MILEIQNCASHAWLQGTFPAAFPCSDESQQCCAAGEWSLQGWKGMGSSQTLVSHRFKSLLLPGGKETGETWRRVDKCVCAPVFGSTLSPPPLSCHHLVTAQPERKRRILTSCQSQTGTSDFLHQPRLFFAVMSPLLFSFHPSGGRLSNIHEDLLSFQVP